MAGIAKPNIENLGAEVSCVINDYRLESGTPQELFDGLTPENGGYAYFHSSSDYIIFTIPHKCNIWRMPSRYGYNSYTNPLKIYQLIDGVYVDVNWKYTQTIKERTQVWEKTIPNLQAGTYKFTGNGYQRADVEWYLEEVEDEYITKDNLSNILIPVSKKTRELAKYDAEQLDLQVLYNAQRNVVNATLSNAQIQSVVNTIKVKTWGAL